MLTSQNRIWYVYILLCKDNSFYTGITLNVEERLKLHKLGKGARYTRIKGVNKILYIQKCLSHSDAAKREIQIKRMPRFKKEFLIKS